MSKSTAPAAAPKLEIVTLLKPHRHNGIPFNEGETIRVNAAERDWLVAHQIIAGELKPEAKE
jgi:hypothetical protein